MKLIYDISKTRTKTNRQQIDKNKNGIIQDANLGFIKQSKSVNIDTYLLVKRVEPISKIFKYEQAWVYATQKSTFCFFKVNMQIEYANLKYANKLIKKKPKQRVTYPRLVFPKT